MLCDATRRRRAATAGSDDEYCHEPPEPRGQRNNRKNVALGWPFCLWTRANSVCRPVCGCRNRGACANEANATLPGRPVDFDGRRCARNYKRTNVCDRFTKAELCVLGWVGCYRNRNRIETARPALVATENDTRCCKVHPFGALRFVSFRVLCCVQTAVTVEGCAWFLQ